ncbi:SRPBCC family protein [Pseudomonas sp. S75]|uniref:SRPBCC family protein n=1 Tax=unclassified Pseudomonas TaxID=196821 RepID=UPI001903B285|nr:MULTISPECIES: SRPBCC family protein [unclassified Pseudomonas]MBJ9978460.1 SRPBCC family protein [Pseudomonas sp. S30]MBK0156457.1 SRPBCC family protein [Pseudomonas sp. S75]
MQALTPDTLIRHPEGCRVVSSVDVPAAAGAVWNIVGNFAGFPVFIPALAHIEMTGSGVRSVRKKLFKDGNVVIEQLNSRDEDMMQMTWSLIYTSLNIGNLWAAMQVEKTGPNSSRATWTIQAEPWEGEPHTLPAFQAFLQGFADDAMSNVRNLLS